MTINDEGNPHSEHEHQILKLEGLRNPSSRTRKHDQEAELPSDRVPIEDDMNLTHKDESQWLRSSARPADDAHNAGDRHHSKRGTHFRLASSAADEERLLRARRRNLLARPDWLGLDVLRPANGLEALSQGSRDKRLIGRRRKVSRTNRNREDTAHPRVLYSIEPAPRFREDMSPNIGLDDIQIKIGTDAFATQTQRSRRSMPSRDTSMRPPPTQLSLLSEESMLLGPDDELFHLGAIPTHHTTRPTEHSVQQLIEPNVHHSHPGNESSPAERNFKTLLHQTPDRKGDSREHGMHSFAEMLVPALLSEPFSPLVPEPQNRVDTHRGQWSKQREHTEDDHTETAHGVEDLEAMDEQVWRRWLDVKTDPSSHASIAAVNSSSMHQTKSDETARVSLKAFKRAAEEESKLAVLSTPRGVGTQGSNLAVQPLATVDESIGQGSPSQSLQQITALANAPPQLPARARQEQEDCHDNELWRSYIIGSLTSSIASPPPEQPNCEDPSFTVGMRSPPVANSSADVSGLDTSAKSCFGDTEDEMIWEEPQNPRRSIEGIQLLRPVEL